MKTKIKTVLLLSILLVICASCRKKDDNKPYNNSSTVTDIDGNVYHTVKIGTQVWMVENLKTTHYNDGTAIPLVTDDKTWGSLTTPGYCWYKNDAAKYKNMNGALYNWYAVNTGKLAPTGWHVPTDTEWTTLQNYLIANGYNYDGSTSKNKFAKSLADTTNWTPDPDTYSGTIGDDLSKNNSTGFSALPGGDHWLHGFGDAGDAGYWWSSTESCTFLGWHRNLAWCRHLCYSRSNLYRDNYLKINGYSVRCVRDN